MTARNSDLIKTVSRVARTMRDQGGPGALSSSEAIVGALLNNRLDWLPEDYRHVIEAFDRLGSIWRAAIVEAHQAGWATGGEH